MYRGRALGLSPVVVYTQMVENTATEHDGQDSTDRLGGQRRPRYDVPDREHDGQDTRCRR